MYSVSPFSKPIIFIILSALLCVACGNPSVKKTTLELSRGPGVIDQGGDEGGIGGSGILPVQDSVARNGLGGSGIADPDEGGIGGTGKLAGNGLGGTGKTIDEGGIGGTGIIGTITAFGSIWVNGAHVLYDSNTPISENQLNADSQSLKLGRIVSVLSRKSKKQYQATEIDIVYEVVAPISEIHLSRKQITVLNQRVYIAKETYVYNENTRQNIQVENLAVNDWVKISGLRDNHGHIHASRIDVIAEQATVQLLGRLQPGDGKLYRIQAQNIEVDSLLLPQDLSRRVFIRGALVGGTLVAESVNEDSMQKILDRAEELLLEGFVYPSDLEDMINVGGIDFTLPMDFDTDVLDDMMVDDIPIHIFGTMDEGEWFEIDDVIILDDVFFDDIDSLEDIEYWED